VSSGTWTAESLTAVIEKHITNLMTHYKGKCLAWDVVNEALQENGDFRESVFYKVLKEDFIPIAFKAAAAADPDAKLFYNDYNIESENAKQKGALKIVDIIKQAGAKIDGVGLQAHFIVGQTPSRSALASVLNSFVDAGVTEVTYTELDIRFDSLPASASGQEQQATDYVNVVGACLDVTACVGVTIWGFTDKYSWIPATFPGQGEACLFSSDLTPKPAYTSVSSLLAAAATTTVQSSDIQDKTTSTTTTTSATTTTSDTTTSTTTIDTTKRPGPTSGKTTGTTITSDTSTTTNNTSDTTTSTTTTSKITTTSETSTSTTATTLITSTRTTGPAGPIQTGQLPPWSQCGGRNWGGGTECAPPYTCKKFNEYYSQCVEV
jgi:endo-1,4-beta-xylanase